MIGLKVIEVLATFVESFLGIWINTEVLGNGADKKKIVYASSVVTLGIWLCNQYKLFSMVISVIGVIGIVIGTYWICNTKIFDSFILSVFYMVLLYIVDFTMLALFGLILRDEQYVQIVTAETSLNRVLTMVLSKTVLAIVSYIAVKKWLCKVELSVRKMRIGVVLSVFLTLYLVNSTYFEVDTDSFLAWLFFLGIVLIAVYSIVQYLQYMQEKNRLNLALEHNHMQLSVYNQLIKDYQDKQIFYHDLKNQYLVIKNYIRNKEYEKAEEYLDTLETAHPVAVYEKRTGIPVVDILIACKIKEAETHQIQVDTVVEMLNTALPEQELIALLGNALDNAIEACRRMKHDAKWVRLAVRSIQDMTMIKVENSYEQQPILNTGYFLSTKEKPQLHGMGIKSMEVIVDKNDGKMKMDYADGVFTLVISFFN